MGDTRREGNETLAVDLSNPSNVTLGTAHAVGTVVDDDAQPAISIADASVTEGNTGTTELRLVASLSAPSGIPVSVNYATANGTATAPADYTSASGTLNFAAGDTTKTIIVTVQGDALDELDETLAVHLSNPLEATIADADAVGTILDDDQTPALSATGGTVSEGDAGSRPLTFTVALSAASGRSVTVNYSTADGTAQAPGDYTATTGTLTFAPGQTEPHRGCLRDRRHARREQRDRSPSRSPHRPARRCRTVSLPERSRTTTPFRRSPSMTRASSRAAPRRWRRLRRLV